MGQSRGLSYREHGSKISRVLIVYVVKAIDRPVGRMGHFALDNGASPGYFAV
jgi:hypothetical protein